MTSARLVTHRSWLLTTPIPCRVSSWDLDPAQSSFLSILEVLTLLLSFSLVVALQLLSPRLRSNLCAPSEVLLRHSSSRIRQRSQWARFLPLIVDNLCIRALAYGKRGIGIGSTRTSGLSTVHVPSFHRQRTPFILLMVSLFHLLCGSNLLISRALNTPPAVPMIHSALLFFSPSHSSLCSWDLLRFASPTVSHQTRRTLVTCVPCYHSNVVRLSRPIWHLDKMLPT